MSTPTVVDDPSAYAAACDVLRRGGGRLGLVPTMGALHEGHLSLVRAARARGAERVVVTIFVNPLQFGPREDFDRYPRTFDDDLAACAAAGVDLVFAPAREAMYPPDFQTHVEVGALTAPLEGTCRPGHFRGVTTVVAKLFALTGPSVAVFGKKDYQQWRVIERMARDLALPVEVAGEPTVREPDGLARSSRNRYLSADERARALAIVRGLRAAHDAFAAGERAAEALLASARAPIEAAADRVDYVALADAATLEALEGEVRRPAVLLVAAFVGATRLIDNLELG